MDLWHLVPGKSGHEKLLRQLWIVDPNSSAHLVITQMTNTYNYYLQYFKW